MNIDPTLVTAAGAIAGLSAAAVYSYLTGNSAGVDIDNDGDADVTVEDGATEWDADFNEGDGDDPEPDIVFSKNTLDEVKGIGPTRADDLAEAGFETVEDIYQASDSSLTDVDGIGEYTVGQIREDIGADDE